MQDPTMLFCSSLATKIGFEEALLLQHLHYWIGESTNHNLVSELQISLTRINDQFSFWDFRVLSRTIKSLIKQKLIIAQSKSDGLYYNINYSAINHLGHNLIDYKDYNHVIESYNFNTNHNSHSNSTH